MPVQSEFQAYVVAFIRAQLVDNTLSLEELVARMKERFPRYTPTVQDIVDASHDA